MRGMTGAGAQARIDGAEIDARCRIVVVGAPSSMTWIASLPVNDRVRDRRGRGQLTAADLPQSVSL